MILNIIVLALGIAAGFLVAWLAKDELVEGRKYFRVLMAASVVLGIFFAIKGQYYLTFSFGFIIIVSLISLIKSYSD